MTTALMKLCCGRVKCLVALRRYTECLRVVEQELEKDPSNVEFIVHRAQLNILFGEVIFIFPI